MKENVDYRLKHEADEFRGQLYSKLKKYNPNHYAIIVSDLIHNVLEDRRLLGRYPIHFLLHSIQSNCLYHHKYRNEKLTMKKFNRIMEHYKQYFDPVAAQFLDKDNGVVPFFINMARQQFYVQKGYGVNSIARSIIIYGEGDFKKSESYFIQTYGITFKEWILIGFGIFASIDKKTSKTITSNYFTNADTKFVSDDAVLNFFELNSVSPDGVKFYYQKIEDKVGKTQSLFYDTYLQSIFLEKPLLFLEDQSYLTVHKQLLLRKVIEGLFDICKKDIPSEFGNEFGINFERYIEYLLKMFLPTALIIPERKMRHYTSRKICDFMIVFDDYIFLIECKGVEYSAFIASENAIKGDNSTRKISTGMEQLSSVAKQIKEGVFYELIGEINDKKIIASVITYKQLYQANSGWYYDTVILPNIVHKDVDFSLFTYKPQILSIEELEVLLKYCDINNKSLYAMFEQKIPKSDFLTGDWEAYLKLESDVIPFLQDKFRRFFDEEIGKKTAFK